MELWCGWLLQVVAMVRGLGGGVVWLLGATTFLAGGTKVSVPHVLVSVKISQCKILQV